MKIKQLSLIFKNKKVLITGNTGFKGSWLSLWMIKFGAKVYGYSNNVPTNPSNYKSLGLNKKITQIFGDVRDKEKFEKKIKLIKPDFIFHLAAQAIVKDSYQNPYKTWETNTFGTINLLEALKKFKKSCTVIIITSDKSYKNLELKRGYKENDILGGKDPYSASKASAGIAVYSYINSFFSVSKNIKIAVARAGNVIGGGDWTKDRLIPDCMKSWSNKKKIIIRNPNSTRPWQHVLEALSGYLFLAYYLKKKKGINGEAFNFGPSKSSNYTVLDILKILEKKLSKFNWSVEKSDKKFYESKLLKLNCNKATKKLGWKSILSINEIIDYLAIWYDFYYKKNKNLYNFSLNQIDEFEKILIKKL